MRQSEEGKRTGTAQCRMGVCVRWTMHHSDTPEDAHTKRVMVPIAMFVMGFSALLACMNYHRPAFVLSMIIQMGAASIFCIRSCLGKCVRTSIDISILMGLIATVLADLTQAAEIRERAWTFIVLLLDLALVFNTPRTVPLVIFLTLGYLFVERLEAGLRFGMYEGIASKVSNLCACSNPPCAVRMDGAMSNWFSFSIVLLFDFYLTRGFSTDLRHQLRRISASVEVAEEIVAALVRYDVDIAEKAITKGADLPEELEQSFLQLLDNLRSYKAYLPHSCLAGQRAPSRSTSAVSHSTDRSADSSAGEGPTLVVCSGDNETHLSISPRNAGRSPRNRSQSVANLRAVARRVRGVFVCP
eukprot:Hpha_TRINITY_DN16323_c2_g5::TRINITY_DN16323_c2_g5_i1::g.60792::m.60792